MLKFLNNDFWRSWISRNKHVLNTMHRFCRHHYVFRLGRLFLSENFILPTASHTSLPVQTHNIPHYFSDFIVCPTSMRKNPSRSVSQNE
jgi:hypothetical protein